MSIKNWRTPAHSFEHTHTHTHTRMLKDDYAQFYPYLKVHSYQTSISEILCITDKEFASRFTLAISCKDNMEFTFSLSLSLSLATE